MNVGYANIYPYRGSIQNMIYLEKLLSEDGHNSFYLTCDSSVPFCYNRLLKGNSRIRECTKCIIGGIRSFKSTNITSIKKNIIENLQENRLKSMVESTAYSLHRIETDSDCDDPEIIETMKLLYPSVDIVYKNAIKWIEENKLDTVLIFNGRLDLTNAILQACRDKSIPFITFEAAYPGIAIAVNEDCRGLKSLNAIIEKFSTSSLNKRQAYFSGNIAAQMLQKKNLVWRLYNTNPEKGKWLTENNSSKILIVPSSNHEFKGSDDWTSNWNSTEEALDAVIDELGVSSGQCILRCHPNWSENIGKAETGHRSERFYTQWAVKRNIHIINSLSAINTNDLINEADVIIVQGGTAGIEAGILGKKVIGLISSWYSKAGFSIQIHGKEDIYKIKDIYNMESYDITRKTLRFLYSYHKRFIQYTESVIPLNSNTNNYYEGSDSSKIINAINQGHVQPDDEEVGIDEIYENEVIDLIREENWDKLIKKYDDIDKPIIKINRKFLYRLIDVVSPIIKSGDR